LVVTALRVTPALGAVQAPKPDLDALTRSGFEHFYSLEYDMAIRDFKQALDARPDDARTMNHLLAAVLFQQLHKYNALDTRLYAKQGFVTSKQVPLDPAVKRQILDLADRAYQASDKRLKSSPKDLEALYDRGVTDGMRATYLVIVEHSWFAALRHALSARHDHEEVLKLKPEYSDAKTIVGAHNFVVGSLSVPMKAMAGVAGIRGDKKKGLEMLAEAARGGGETSSDARVALSLFLRREDRFEDSLQVVRELIHDHPRNFLFALEEDNLLRDLNRKPEALAKLRKLLNDCKQGKYPNAHLELAQYSLGETLRAMGQLGEAQDAYRSAAAPGGDNGYRQKALLGWGEAADLQGKRDEAQSQYRAAIAIDASTDEADAARKYLEKPFRGK
jgi:tetratricopeptide (TPR) repeat protein